MSLSFLSPLFLFSLSFSSPSPLPLFPSFLLPLLLPPAQDARGIRKFRRVRPPPPAGADLHIALQRYNKYPSYANIFSSALTFCLPLLSSRSLPSPLYECAGCPPLRRSLRLPAVFFNIRLPVCAKKCTFVRYFCIEVHNRKKTTSLTNPNL